MQAGTRSTGGARRRRGQAGSVQREEPLAFSPLLPDVPPPLPAGVNAANGTWRAERLPCRRLSPAIGVAGRGVMRGYQYRAREGRFYLEAWDAVARLSGEAGQTIVLPAQSLFHIEQMHVGDQATSRFAGVVSVTTLLREVAQRLPVEIVFEHSEARFEFELARLVGTDAVASHQDMLERGQLTRDELARLEPLRARVERLNLFGSEAERKAFREAANGELAGTRIEFFMRRGALVQQYRGRPASTRWVAIAIHRGGRGPGAPAEIRTLYPGRVRPPLPAGHWYFRHYGADRPSRGLAILEKLARDETLSKRYELAAVAGQRRAQDFWWRHGFVAPG